MRAQILRLFWVTTVLFAAAFAILAARVTGLVAARALWQPEAPLPAAAARAAQRARVELLSDFRVIDDRNLFGVRPAPPPPPPVVVVPPPPPIAPPTAPPPPPPPPEPPLSLQLMGTAVVDGGKSFAIVVANVSGANEMRVVKEGEEAAPGAVLLAVRADRILVSWRGRTEEVMLTEGRGAAPPSAPRGRTRPGLAASREASDLAAGSTPPGPSAPGGGESVRRVADDRWVVDPREVEQMRNNMGSMMTQVRVVPNFAEGGQPDGFKVFAIRPGSLFARIGLQNGDVIRRINGIEIQAPDQAMEAYQRLKDETSIQIDVMRQNQPKTLNYEIR